MFIDREIELKFLERQYRDRSGNFILIYGRRRIGKTCLIQEFSKGKPNIYFLGTLENKFELIKKYSIKLAEFFNDPITEKNPFTSWDLFFEYLISKATNVKDKLLLIFDEITYIISVDKSFLSIFQKYYDMYLKNMKIMIILSGSLINVIYNDILSYSSPLYGRRTGNIELKEFKFKDVYSYFHGIPLEKIMRIYFIYGGIPYYLSLLLPDQDPVEQFIYKGNIFYNDAEFILREELHHAERYFSILKLLASGHTSISEIASIMKYSTSELSPYVDKLVELDLILKEYPLYNKKRNNGIYKIKSNYFNFYFRYIFGNQEYMNDYNSSLLLNKINKNLNEYMLAIFENICMELLQEFSNQILGAEVLEIGKWWGRNKNKDKGYDIEEIDILGKDSKDRHFFCEVKYRNKKMDINVLEDLKRKAALFDFNHNIFVLFSFSGFEERLKSIAKLESNVVLVDSIKIEKLIKVK